MLKTPELESFPIIFDNTVLSNFALVQEFGILQTLYSGKAYVSQAVLQEISAGKDSGWQYPWLKSRKRLEAVGIALSVGWLRIPNSLPEIKLEQTEVQLTQEYRQCFGKGEGESMAIALFRGWIFASDDGTARKFAQKQGIRLTGTLGILIKATTAEILSLCEADLIHSRMIDEGYRSPLPYNQGISTFFANSR